MLLLWRVLELLGFLIFLPDGTANQLLLLNWRSWWAFSCLGLYSTFHAHTLLLLQVRISPTHTLAQWLQISWYFHNNKCCFVSLHHHAALLWVEIHDPQGANPWLFQLFPTHTHRGWGVGWSLSYLHFKIEIASRSGWGSRIEWWGGSWIVCPTTTATAPNANSSHKLDQDHGHTL